MGTKAVKQESMFATETDFVSVPEILAEKGMAEPTEDQPAKGLPSEVSENMSEAKLLEVSDNNKEEATPPEAVPVQPNPEEDTCLLPDGSIDVKKQEEKFRFICKKYITDPKRQEGMEKLLSWLASKDFFSAPASTQYHGAYEGGLCQHSIDVWECARKLNNTDLFQEKFSEEALCVASLFHDICKVGLYVADYKNKKNENGEWVKVPYYTIEEEFHFGGHGSKSVYLLQWFLKLTNEEAVAINCHMGFSDGSPTVIRDTSNAFHQFPMAWLIHVADEAATFLMERDLSKKQEPKKDRSKKQEPKK